MEELLVDKAYQLEKFPGKGGWTYVAIPEVSKNEHAYFGIVKVSGSIDSFELKDVSLLPMGSGRMFLPVKAEIRKKIGKQEGDWVQLRLFAENSLHNVREELLLCLQDEPTAFQSFLSCTEAEQQALVEWIFAAKTDDMKVARIVQTIDKLLYSKSRELAATKQLSN
ncbi:YdeI/OmpD-associated family protein [Pontibacter beigongshangensis]|uniref:YdeI/OmpD-associated family protein n=1 Tax=Pontibacter beigongshangensis TaxID=2574733 RepID=UPI00164F2B60|nr:YdeI/OmpD-associated family protein [Pontibacter beigongshangensis]